MAARLTELFEGGTHGATIAVAGPIAFVNGTPTYSNSGPLQGALSMDLASSTASTYVRVNLTPGTATHSGSVQLKPISWTTGSMTVVRFGDSTNAPLATISMTASNKFAILDSTSTAQATSTTGVWALGTAQRLDWQYDATAPTAPVITLRIFANLTDTTPVQTISATVATVLTFDRWLLGRVGTSTGAWAGKFDAFRIADGLEWLGPYGTVNPLDGRGLKYHMNRKAGTLDAFDLPKWEATKAANIWAGTTDLELVHALNVKAGNTPLLYKELAGVLNQLAGTSSLEVDGAAASIL